MRVKQDAIPGMTVPLWFEATETGSFEVGCAQLCGLGHYRMKGYMTIDTAESFAAWMKEQAELASFEDDYY
jgi:cytochrome c oxidase subunit 2